MQYSSASVVQNNTTGVRRTIKQGNHVLSVSESLVEFSWSYKEEGSGVKYLKGFSIPLWDITINTSKITVHTRCETAVIINGAFTYRIVDPVKALKCAQPLEYMCLQVSSNTTEVFGRYSYKECFSKKRDIQEAIAEGVTKDMKERGFQCTEFIIETIQKTFNRRYS